LPKVYDCFLFHDELRILRLRFEELDSAVDYFVLVESPFTFTGLPKPLHFEQHKHDFANLPEKSATLWLIWFQDQTQ
jgi:beta-1,4-mannosyl-glycoprotein beta-1,4-N-acetylglucosaminyltransferase